MKETMELKKFEAPTLAEALQVVKRELGPEAVILSTKNKKSAWGLMNKTSVEVTAAVDPSALNRKKAAENRLTEDQREALFRKPAHRAAAAYEVLSGDRLAAEIERSPAATVKTRSQAAAAIFQKPAARQAMTAASAPAPAPMTQRRYIDIRDDEGPAEQATLRSSDRAEIRTPQSSLVRQAAEIARTRAAAAPAPTPASSLVTTSSSVSAGARNVLPRLLARLIDAGIEEDLVRDVGDELKSIMIREQITQEELLNLQLARVLMSRFRAARPLGERLRIPTTPRVIVFVGPTGVGKTTTIAKIAAELVIHQRRPVTLATTDTYKIAAVEQLQTYANILKVPLEVCPTAEALAELGSRVGSEEVVLVDTAGFGPRDEKKVHELQDVLSGVRCETHLCVSATTRDRDLRDMARRFAVFKPDYLVVTKTDETTAYGNVYNIAVRSHYPLSYFTMGQRVPEDIEIATKERVADLLLNITGEN
jgi:flagellar biosynthesis protein FlhF